jgi:hypothetical protein
MAGNRKKQNANHEMAMGHKKNAKAKTPHLTEDIIP